MFDPGEGGFSKYSRSHCKWWLINGWSLGRRSKFKRWKSLIKNINLTHDSVDKQVARSTAIKLGNQVVESLTIPSRYDCPCIANYLQFSVLSHQLKLAKPMMASDGGENADIVDASLVPLLNCTLPNGLFVTIIDEGQELQSQWWLVPLMSQIFSTKDSESLRDHFTSKFPQFRKIHEEMWPGFELPPILLSKFESESSEGDKSVAGPHQPVFLRQKTVPTSVAMAMLGWAVSKGKRMPKERLKSQDFMRQLLNHVLAVAGTLSFDVVPVGKGLPGRTIRVSTLNDCLDFQDLWIVTLKGRIAPRWNFRKLAADDEQVTSNWDRPQWIDFILFSLDPTNTSAVDILRRPALNILAQVASWMDGNMSKLAVTAESIGQIRQKTRRETMVLTNQVMRDAAMFLLHDNDPLLEWVIVI